VTVARALILVCSLLALSACGAATREQSADTPQVASLPSPAIEAIDEPYPDASWWGPPDDAASSSGYICLGDESTSRHEGDCEPSPEMKEKLRLQEEEYARAIKPATGSEPRAVAQLRLSYRGPQSRALLVAWRTQRDQLCLDAEEEDADGGSGGGPFGPCADDRGCGPICIDLSGTGLGMKTRYHLSGVVAARGDRLRMTLDDGRVVTYELTGPLVPHFPEYRVFMLDLGRDLYERIELLRDGKVLAEEKQSRLAIRSMRCSEKYPVNDMPRTSQEAEKSPLAQCFEKARSE
jgi:hypothetical protein